MVRIHHVLILAALVTAMNVVARGAEQPELPLINLLQSNAPPAEKAITCKKLAVYGTAQAVPALAPLLADPELSSWARIALEAIPDPAADAALRDAMSKLDGRLLIGVINSIGVRGDTNAVEGLVQRLSHSDPQVASAAAAALGKIGDTAATSALQQALANTSGELRSAVAEGCILCAEKMIAEGNPAAAAALFDEVRQAELPPQRLLEATRGAILARGPAGVPLLLEQLQSSDKRLFALGLTTARELAGSEATAALVAELGRAAPQRQALLVQALADRGDVSALPAVLQMARGGAAPAHIAALGVVKRLGDATCIPTLLEVTGDDNADVAEAAKATLEVLPGDDVNRDLTARLNQATGKTRRVLIELAGLRRLDAQPALLKAVDDPDAATRAAALTALGETVELDNLDVLLKRVVAPQNSSDTEVAKQALRAASVRMPDREACAEKLAAAMSQAPESAKATMLQILSSMGGTRSLQAVGAAAKKSTPELQDAASQMLGEWMTVDAAPVLLDLAKSSTEAKYQIRALRGYIRLARQFTMSDEDRVAMCRAAMQTATRDAERKLVLEVLERYPSIDMLKLAVDTAKTASLKNDASATALAIAREISGNGDVQKLLTQIGQEPVKVEILKAEYGANGQFKDVTAIVQQQTRDLPLIVLPSANYNASFGGDPVPSVQKQLKIQYKINGKTGEATFAENAAIVLPMP